jgi:ParB family chromosome partitioning protein
MPARKPPTRRKKVPASSKGLAATDTASVQDADLTALTAAIDREVARYARYRDPVGGRPLILASLPVDRVEPTPYQRDASDTHVKRLMTVVEKIGVFLDPIIVVHRDAGYWTPNGNHRLQALKKLGYRAVTALVVPDADVAFKIWRSTRRRITSARVTETIRMARALAETSGATEEASHSSSSRRHISRWGVLRSTSEVFWRRTSRFCGARTS